MRPVPWLVLVFLLSTAVPATARPPRIPLPHLTITPTVGVWRWDERAAFPGSLPERTRPVYGARIGFARFEALSVEAVGLYGTADVEHAGGAAVEHVGEARLVQAELSLLVNFRSLIGARVYPFVALGVGGSFQSSDIVIDGDDIFRSSHVNYHLGGGIKGDLGSRVTARLNVRDTFFNDSRTVAGQKFQNTLDTIEISIALDYRIPLSPRKGGGRLR